VSLLNFWCTPKEAVLAVDTAAVAEDGSFSQTSKLFTFPHLNAVFAARGESVFHACLSMHCHVGNPQSFDQLVAGIPAILPVVEAIVKPHRGVFDKRYANIGNELVFAGWSHERSRMLGWVFRKVADMEQWQSGEIKFFHAPPSSVATGLGIPNEPAAIERFASAQMRFMRKDSAWPGGGLIVCRATKDALSLTRVMEFAEREAA
jgi:hypothetical protein